MKWRNAILAALIIVPLVVVLALGFGNDPHRIPSVLEGRMAPDFSLPTVDGNKTINRNRNGNENRTENSTSNVSPPLINLNTLRGNPVVINFWSTWCEPCKAEHELLQQAARTFAGRVQFLGVVYQDDETKVKDYLAQRSNNYPQLLDTDSTVAIDFGVAGVPETFFIDAAGTIRYKHAGVLQAPILYRIIDQLLKAPAADQTTDHPTGLSTTSPKEPHP